MTCCDRGYGRPSWRPRVSAPATYRLGTPRNQHPAVARWHAHLRGLATAIHEISGLAERDPMIVEEQEVLSQYEPEGDGHESKERAKGWFGGFISGNGPVLRERIRMRLC